MICARCTTEIQTDHPEGGVDSCAHCGESPILAGTYRLVSVLSQGTEGATYRAVDINDETEVAIKKLMFQQIESLESEELFRRQTSVLRQLDHPAIPDYIDDFVDESQHGVSLVLVQQFIDGVTLGDETDDRRYDEGDVLEILGEIAAVLDYMHGLKPPVIHRDIKPSNIMRRHDDGQLMLVDFGSVKESIHQKIGEPGSVAGSYGYMAPEQLQGDARPRSDVYAVGATAVELLCRVAPDELMDDDSGIDWQNSVRVRPRLQSLIDDMLAVDPDQRPTSGELLERIERLQRRSAPDDDEVPSQQRSTSGQVIARAYTPKEGGQTEVETSTNSDSRIDPIEERNRQMRNITIVAFLGLMLPVVIGLSSMWCGP